MTLRACLLLLLVAVPVGARAGFEGAPVTPGPVTALTRLDSIKDLPAMPQARRPFAIQSWTTANGAHVLFVAADELPMLDVRMVFDAGAARDGDLAGLASTVASMMDEGTPTRDTSAIAKSFETVGASFGANAYRDMAVLDLRVLSDAAYLDSALDVLADVVAHPQFPEQPFARIQKANEIGQEQQEQSPSALASRIFYKALYGDHPYASPPSGTRETLKKIRREDLVAFHQRYYVARNLTIAMVGALTRAQAEQVAEKITAGLPAGEPAPGLPAVKPLAKARRLQKDFPSEQTHILIGEPGIRRGDPDFYALLVGNEILGGGSFTSLLTREIRQKRGLTYGVYSGFTPMRAQGPFLIGLSTRADQTAEALKLAQQVLTDFVRDGPDNEAVKEAKDNIIRGFPLDTASNSSIVGYLGLIGFYHLPLDYLDEFLTHIGAVTADDIHAAFRRHVDPSRLLVVTVGRKGK